MSLITSSTAEDESLFHGISISNEPIYENFIENGRLFVLIRSLIFSCLNEACWMFILPAQKPNSTFYNPVKN